jgi:DNA-binding Lrp family transcriptional regulator
LASSQLMDERDFEILKYIVGHPTASMAEIANSLHYRPETVSNHVESLRNREIYTQTMALLCYKKLGMSYVPVVVRAPLLNLEDIYASCRAHPYIQYSTRTLGANDGAFLVFTIPTGAIHQLVEFLDELAARGVIIDHRIYITDDTKRDFLKADLRIFNPEAATWNFDWNKWYLTDEVTKAAADGGQRQELLILPEVNRLDHSDIELLHILSDKAEIPTEEMAKATELEPHNVRRRIRSLEDNGFIIGYRAMVAYSKLHLSSTMLFNCNAQPMEVEVCKNRLLTLPFPGTFIPVQNGFLCQATLPAEGLPPVHRFLASHCSSVEISWFDLASSDVAVLNSKAYQGDCWRIDPQFLIEEPLRAIHKKN